MWPQNSFETALQEIMTNELEVGTSQKGKGDLDVLYKRPFINSVTGM